LGSRLPLVSQALGKLGRAKVRVILTVDPREEAAVLANLQLRKFYGACLTFNCRLITAC
jgi:hypothetical protein